MPAFASINEVAGCYPDVERLYTTVCTLLKQISRMAAGTHSASLRAGSRRCRGRSKERRRDRDWSKKEGSPPMKTKSSRFDTITRFSFVTIASRRFARAARERLLCDCQLEFLGEKTNISSGFRVCEKDSEDAAAVSCPASSRPHRRRNHCRARIR